MLVFSTLLSSVFQKYKKHCKASSKHLPNTCHVPILVLVARDATGHKTGSLLEGGVGREEALIEAHGTTVVTPVE